MKVDYLPFAKVLYEERNGFMQAIQRSKWKCFTVTELKERKCVCFTFRREDSLNYLNGRIPERWFCFKFTLFVLRKGKHSLVYLETLGQMLSKTDHTQGQIQCSNTWKLFPARTLNLLRTFLVCGSSSVSFFSTLWLKDCSSNMSLFSGSYTVSQATLVGLPGGCYCCVSFTLITIVIF